MSALPMLEPRSPVAQDGGMATPGTTAADDPLAIERPAHGRVRGHRRRVQLGDVTPGGRVRLDAVARFLQDVSDEDTTDAGFPPDAPWVVRRADVGIARFPVFREWIEVSTWCSGTGGRWAERRVRIDGDAGGRVDAAVLWVHLDATGRPARLPAGFDELYAEASGGRRVRARLQHDAPPAPPSGLDQSGTPFPLRFCDFDVQGHVNNAISWVMVEEAWSSRSSPAATEGVRVSVEHPAPIERGATPMWTTADVASGFDLWATVDDTVVSTAQARRWAPPAA